MGDEVRVEPSLMKLVPLLERPHKAPPCEDTTRSLQLEGDGGTAIRAAH